METLSCATQRLGDTIEIGNKTIAGEGNHLVLPPRSGTIMLRQARQCAPAQLGLPFVGCPGISSTR
jgi:hypothetical protein